MRNVRWSVVFLGITLAALGVIGLVQRDLMPIWAGVPDGMTGRAVLVYLTGLLTVCAGVGLLWPKTTALAARVLLAAFGAWLLLVRLPVLISAPLGMNEWWGCGDTAVMIAAAWSVWGGPRVRIGRVLFGVGLIPFGVAHIVYVQYTAPLVPHWLPGPTAVAYGTGAAFIAAGIGIATGVLDRLAATLVTLQILGFTVIVWIPVLLGHPGPHDWAEFYNSWALAAGSWVVAEGFRGGPWLGFPRRPSV